MIIDYFDMFNSMRVSVVTSSMNTFQEYLDRSRLQFSVSCPRARFVLLALTYQDILDSLMNELGKSDKDRLIIDDLCPSVTDKPTLYAGNRGFVIDKAITGVKLYPINSEGVSSAYYSDPNLLDYSSLYESAKSWIKKHLDDNCPAEAVVEPAYELSPEELDSLRNKESYPN